MVWVHGKTVSNGVVNFTSASALQKADASTSTGCLRAWAYDYKLGIKEPKSKAMERGIKLHGELETFLATGERAQLSSLALSGLHMLPPPGQLDENGNPRLFIEHPMVPVNPATGQEDLKLAPLRLHGVPLYGKLDLMHALGINYGTEDIEDTHEQPGTVEVADHKTTSDIKNAKLAKELPDSIQMALYGEYVFTVAPDTKLVRLSHNYFPERGNARKVSIVVDRDRLQPTWNHALAITASIKHAAAESNIDLIDANVRACRAYGRDCPARSQCRAAQHNSLASFVGGTAADRMLKQANPLSFLGEPTNVTAPAPNTLLARLASLSPSAPAPAAPTPAPPAIAAPTVVHLPVIQPAPAPIMFAPVAAAPVAAPTPIANPDVLAEMQRLMGAIPTPAVSPYQQIIDAILAHGVGFPTLAGQAAADKAAHQGLTITSGAGLAGSGLLAAHMVNETSELASVLTNLNDIAARAGVATAKEAYALATEAAAQTAPAETTSTPATVETTPTEVAADTSTETPTDGKKPRKPRGPNKKKQPPTEPAQILADAGVADPAAALAAAPVVATGPIIHDANDPGYRAAITVEAQPSPEQVVSEIVAKVEDSRGNDVFVPGTSSKAIVLYVDVVLEGLAAKSLWPLVHQLSAIVDRESGAATFKATEKFGYGKGEAVVGAMLRDMYANGKIAGGRYTLDGSSSSLGQAVVEAMRDVCQRSGGYVARGVK